MVAKYRIGYIDEDDKQVKLYRRKLRNYGFDVIGYEFEKGMTFKDLMSQVYQSDIDLLMIDYKLNETNIVPFNGDAVENDIYDKRPLFPHIIFTNKVDQAEPFVEDMKIIFDKEQIFNDNENDEVKVQRFVVMLTKSIEQYRNHIEKKKKLISDLLIKGQNEELNSNEKDTLLKIQREIQNLDKTKKSEIPEKLISLDKIEDLTKSRKEAEEFLQSLIDKNRNK